MVNAGRLLASAVLIHLALSTAALAQTAVVRNAPPGSTVELVLSTSVAATAVADARGTATLLADAAVLGDERLDALVWVDVCGPIRRLVVASRSVPPPAAGACARNQIEGLFLVQAITTLVVDLAPSTPSLRVRQGPAPAEWLVDVADIVPRETVAPPTGLLVFGGAGFGTFRDFAILACGSVDCTSDESPIVLTGGVSYWFSRFVGAEASFVKPLRVTAEGSTETFEFGTDMESGLLTLSALGGVPIGPFRAFGRLGATVHRATRTVTQTIEDRTITVDGEPQSVPGGTQTFQFRTEGYGWVYAGGAEYWLSRWFAVYGEAGLLAMTGDDVGGSEGRVDDRMRFILAGVRIRILGR